jgi:hypothetical protein
MANGIASLAPQQNPMMGAAPPQMLPQGVPGQEDPEALLQQIAASGLSSEDIEASTLASLQEADPQLVKSIMEDLQGVTLPSEAKQELLELIMEMLKDPEGYTQILQEAVAEGLPADMFPPEYNVEVLSALRFVISQIPSEDGTPEVQGFRKGGLVSLKPIAKFLQEQGRNGDTILAHINPQEAALLKSRGGAGTINPITGLREYKLKSKLKKAFKKIGDVIGDTAKSIGNAVEKVVKSDVGKAVLAVGAVLLAAPTGGASLAAASGSGILSSIGSGLAAVATSPAGISALATTGVQLAQGKSLSEAAKDGLKVGAAVGIGASVLGGSVSSAFGVGNTIAGPYASYSPLDVAARSVGTIAETVAAPFSGMGLKEIVGVGSAIMGAKTAYDSAQDAREQAAVEKQTQQAVLDQIQNPPEARPFEPGGVASSPEDSTTPPPINTPRPPGIDPILDSPAPPPINTPRPPGIDPILDSPAPPIDATVPSPGPAPNTPFQPPSSFAIPPSQYSGFNPFSFLNSGGQQSEAGTTQIPFAYSPFSVPQQPSFQDFLAMYGGGGGKGIQSFANGGPVYMKTGGSAADAAFRAKQNAAAFRAKQNAAINAAAFSNKPQAYYNAAGKQISKAEWEANQARMKADNKAIQQQDKAYQSSTAEAARIASFNARMAEQERQRRIQAAADTAAARAAAAKPPAPVPQAPAPVPQAPAPVPQAPAPVPPPPVPVPEAPGGIATLPEAPQLPPETSLVPENLAPAPMPEAPAPMPEMPAPMPEMPAPMPEMPAPMPEMPAPMPEMPAPMPEAPAPMPAMDLPAPMPEAPAPMPAMDLPAPMPEAPGGIATLPGAPAPMPEAPAPMPEVPVQIPQMPVFQQPEVPVQIPQMPVFQQPEAPAPMPPIPQPQVQPLPYNPFPSQPVTSLPYIPPNTFYNPVDFGNPGNISFNPAPGLYSGTVPSSFNQGGIAAVAPSRFNKGGASRFYPRKTGPINGPGTGTSDSIPAMLSDGEFVFTARAVRGAGNGSRLEGAKKMYQMMKSLERKSR